MSFLPSQKSLRFLTHHHHHRQTPHHHTHRHRHPRLHTHIHMPQNHVRLPHFFIHRNIPQSPPHVHDHSYASLPTTQTDAITKVNNWMKDGSVCSDSSSSSEAVTAARRATPADVRRGRGSVHPHTAASTRYCLTNPFSHPFEHIHASSIFMPSSNHPHRQTSLQNTHARKLKSSCDDNFRGFVTRLTFLKRGGLALVLETPKEINTILKQTKWDEDFFGKDLYIHLANKDARPWLCCKQSPSNNGIGKKLRKGISNIDPVVGSGIIGKSKSRACIGSLRGSYPTPAGPLQSSERSGS